MKLIALDMDGTTLSSNNDISSKNVQAIRKAQNLGHIVMVLSGRAPESIRSILTQYELDCPIGASNGTAVFAEGKLLDLTSLTPFQNKQIVWELEEAYIPYKIYTNKGIFIPYNWVDRLDKVLSSGNVPEEHFLDENFDRSTRHPSKADGDLFFKSMETILEDPELTIQKFFILALNPVQKQRLEEALKRIKDVYITTSSPFNIEAMHISGNKGNGLKVMAGHYQIPLKDTIAIGDQKNDIPMFKVAGRSIAMGNAEDPIKSICDFVTLSNDEDGVAYAIENYIIKQENF
jgi:Cof subfamily protein (haloacid dehalogenase superfamily)